MLLTLVVDGQNDFTTIHYRGLRPDDWGGLKALRNPGRGFMVEDTIDVSMVKKRYNTELDSTSNLMKSLAEFDSDSITLVHTTLFLPPNGNKPIPDSALKWIKTYLDTLHGMGLKCILHPVYKIGLGSAGSIKQADLQQYDERLRQLLLENSYMVEVQEGLLDAWSLAKNDLADGYKAAKQFMLQHTRSYGLSLNKGVNSQVKKNPIDNWRNLPVDPDRLLADKLPFSTDYFKSANGDIVQRPLYDYIRDYLGYRIELQQLTLPFKRPDNSPIHLKLDLINRGFSALKQPVTAGFVLIDPNGTVYELASDADPTTWLPYDAGETGNKPVSYSVEYQGKLPLHLIPGRYKLGFWIADGSRVLHYDYRYAVRCANGNMGWWISRDKKYGVNILTNLTISK